ncbi:MAG: type II toxin-antitoxin system PemK/MazF family toxin [Cyclobacteriaceae bacterium]|jgi:mRNA interferase MazF|nr:type II toxin-antitoxin system PemK/MazF family toxin [Cyclobacteriaceae bacterium]
MKQGEIWELYLNPVDGSEQPGRRPAVILSGNMMNNYLNVIIVCPLTTKIKNYKGNVVLNPNNENNLKQTSEVLTFHVRSVSKIRLKKLIGVISIEELKIIKQGLNDILRY